MKKLSLPLALVAIVTLLFSCHKALPFTVETLVLQPDNKDGQDCLVATRESDNDFYASQNHSLNPDVAAIVWTYDADNAGVGINRTYIKFTGLSELPANAKILSAKLALFGVEEGVAAPIGNSFYPGSPYESYGSNACVLKRVTGDWNEGTITWNNKPETTDQDKATVPASTSQWNYDAKFINVTNMVKTMVKTGENNGFCLQLKTEQYYKGVVFGSSEHPDPARRPKLTVEYAVYK